VLQTDPEEKLTDPRQLELIHDLAANYSDRQGLRIVPIGLAVLCQALPLPDQLLGFDPHFALLVAGVLGYLTIGRLYARRYGSVEELPYPGPSPTLQVTLALLLLLMTMMLDIVTRPPVFLSGLLIALWIGLVGWPARLVRAQYLVIGVLLGLTSFLPLFGVRDGTMPLLYGVLFGVSLVVSGIADHILFTRLLREPAHE
jgi:hypothetical protein